MASSLQIKKSLIQCEIKSYDALTLQQKERRVGTTERFVLYLIEWWSIKYYC